MRAIVNAAPGQLAWQELPMPEPAAGQVRVRTAACGICATDLAVIEGRHRVKPPTIPGHEWAGVVDAVGPGVDAACVGRACVGENVLSDGREVGFEHPGGYAAFFLTEADKLRWLPPSPPWTTAALTEPLAVCVRAMSRLGLLDRRQAVILGDGAIGLIMLLLLRRAGVERVLLVGGRPQRLAVAAELGAAETLNYHHLGSSLEEAVCARWGRLPNVVEASGSPAAAQAGLSLVTRAGRLLVLGEYGAAQPEMKWCEVVEREIELIGSCASAGAWDEAARLISSGELPLARLATHSLPAERYVEGMALARDRGGEAIKVVLLW